MIRALLPLALLPPPPAFAEEAPVAVTDGSGDVLTFEAPPTRLACLSQKCVHIARVLGVVPVAIAPQYVFAMARDPSMLGEAAVATDLLPATEGFDLEALAALDPDLVVGWPGIDADLPPEFMDGVAPVYEEHETFMAPDLATLTTDLVNLGAVLGRSAEAEAFVARLGRRLAAYRALRPDQGASFAHVRLEDPEAGTLWVAPCATTLLAELVECAWDGDEDWVQMTSEGLLALDPDVIVVEDLYDDAYTFTPDEWAEVPLWNEVRAVRDGRVHFVPAPSTGPFSELALARALDALMPLLYPDVFPAPLTDEQVAAALASE